MYVRLCTATDFDLIIDLAQQIWSPAYSAILSAEQLDFMFQHTYTQEHLARQVAEGQRFYLLYKDDGQALGFAAWSWLDEIYADKPLPKLNKIYILPSAQGSGAGRFLLEYVETIVQTLGAKALQLCVNRQNKARFFYEKLGYRILYEADFPFHHYFMNDFLLQKDF